MSRAYLLIKFSRITRDIALRARMHFDYRQGCLRGFYAHFILLTCIVTCSAVWLVPRQRCTQCQQHVTGGATSLEGLLDSS